MIILPRTYATVPRLFQIFYPLSVNILLFESMIGEYRKNNALAYSERFFINLRFNHFLTGSS